MVALQDALEQGDVDTACRDRSWTALNRIAFQIHLSQLNKAHGVGDDISLTLPRIYFVARFDFLVKLKHLGRRDDETVLGLVVLNLLYR